MKLRFCDSIVFLDATKAKNISNTHSTVAYKCIQAHSSHLTYSYFHAASLRWLHEQFKFQENNAESTCGRSCNLTRIVARKAQVQNLAF